MLRHVSLTRPTILLLAGLALPLTTACRSRPVTTRPSAETNSDVVSAHDYAVPREQLSRHIEVALAECGWKPSSVDAAGGVFVATRHQALFDVNSTLTVVVRPDGERLRVDVTLTSGQYQLPPARSKEQVWAFYDALDRKSGEPKR